jgi:hypothetical protein
LQRTGERPDLLLSCPKPLGESGLPHFAFTPGSLGGFANLRAQHQPRGSAANTQANC